MPAFTDHRVETVRRLFDDNEVVYAFAEDPSIPGAFRIVFDADFAADGSRNAPRAFARLAVLTQEDGAECRAGEHFDEAGDDAEAPSVGWIIEDGERGFVQRFVPFGIVDTGDEAYVICDACVDALCEPAAVPS